MIKYLIRVSKKTSTSEELSAETIAMMEESRKEFAEGKVITFDTAADAQKWLESL